MLALETEIFEIKTTTSSLVGSIQEVKAHTVETKTRLKKAPETAAVQDSQLKLAMGKFLSLTEALSSIRVERANLREHFDAVKALVKRIIADVEKSVFKVSMEVPNTYKYMAEGVKQRVQADLVNGWE